MSYSSQVWPLNCCCCSLVARLHSQSATPAMDSSVDMYSRHGLNEAIGAPITLSTAAHHHTAIMLASERERERESERERERDLAREEWGYNSQAAILRSSDDLQSGAVKFAATEAKKIGKARRVFDDRMRINLDGEELEVRGEGRMGRRAEYGSVGTSRCDGVDERLDVSRLSTIHKDYDTERTMNVEIILALTLHQHQRLFRQLQCQRMWTVDDIPSRCAVMWWPLRAHSPQEQLHSSISFIPSLTVTS